jgi:hypothetical protein
MTKKELQTEMEILRIQLAVCGAAARAYTRHSMEQQGINKDSIYYSASYEDILRVVKRELLYREALEKLSCLGNGDQLGNSTGNCIAIEALRGDKE